MSITRLAIEKSRVTTVILVVIVLAGLGAYASLPRAMDPGFTIRVAQVMTLFPGASPERVEMLVSEKIEKAVQELPELDFVNSTSKTGVSIVLVNVKEKYTDMRPIWDKLRRKVEDVESSLPDDVIGPFVNDDFGDVFGIVVNITGDGFSFAEMKAVADEVRDELLQIPEVSKVEVLGEQDENIFVEYDSATLSRFGLSPAQLQQILASRNIIIPGGQIAMGIEKTADGTVDKRGEGAEMLPVEPTGNFESIDDLRRTVVTVPGRNQVVFLDDIVDIRRGYVDPPERALHTNGVSSLGLAISLREGDNIIKLGDKVSALLDRLPGAYPHGIDFHVVAFEPERVSRKVDEFVGNVLQSILIVLGVMLITLGLRTGFLVASLIPTTMIMALLIMSLLDIGLDQVSLASLIIALGMLVDNAIVITESIQTQVAEGKSVTEASVASAAELRIPLLTSSLTTAAAFLPIYLAESSVGEYTNPIFKVVTISLLSSWILALTMIPLLCTFFVKRGAEQKGLVAAAVGLFRRGKKKTEAKSSGFGGTFYRGYRRVLVGMLRLKYVTIVGAIGVFIVSMMGFAYVPKLFFPTIADTQFTATFRLPIGTPIERTREVMKEIEAYVATELLVDDERNDGVAKRTDGVTSWATFIGEGAPRFVLGYSPEPPAPEYAFMLINTNTPSVNEELIEKLEVFANGRFPDLDSKIELLAAGPPVNFPIQVRLSGKDTDKLFELADQVSEKVRSIPGTKNITDDWGARSKKLVIDVDQQAAYRTGVTNQDIAISLLTNLSGFETSQYREADRVIPITMRSVAKQRDDIGRLTSLPVYVQQSGKNVPLSSVAEGHFEFQPAKVLRRNRLRTVTIQALLEPGITAAEINAKLVPWLEEKSKSWEFGYRFGIGGEAESSGKANASIAEKMPIAGFIILILLVMQFNSMRRTAIILFTIPMALIGVVFGLLVAKSYFGFMTLLGIVSLAGIVINNAIVLLERIELEIADNGLAPARAVVEAAQRRLRPILLTTATTIGGLIPLWLGGGAMFEPMAIAIIFGLLFSTILTLGVVPALYAILFRVSYKGFSYDS
jgi:multidrug efflux pump subunit AcrB